MDASLIRKRKPVSALLDPKIVVPAVGAAFVKLDPRTLMKNPIMFVLEIVTILTSVILIRDLVRGGEHIFFEFQIICDHCAFIFPYAPLRQPLTRIDARKQREGDLLLVRVVVDTQDRAIQAQAGRDHEDDVLVPTFTSRDGMREGMLRIDRLQPLRSHLQHGGLKRSN